MVSDTEKMPDGAEVVIYTRVWNDEDKRYEFYVVDYDGTLKRAYDGGDTIQWAGNNLNTAKWDFTEYHHDETADPLVPNYYYELYNSYSREYLVPHQAEGTVLSDSKVGINLNGRKYGEAYTSIIAWDQEAYAFSGLKVENGQIVSCPKSEAMDFFFAIMQDPNVDDDLTTVATVDNNQYGIKMKMSDFTNGSTSQMLAGSMNAFLQSTTSNGATFVHTPGLLSTDLGADGYPVTTRAGSGGSLGGLYASGTDYRDVNSFHCCLLMKNLPFVNSSFYKLYFIQYIYFVNPFLAH